MTAGWRFEPDPAGIEALCKRSAPTAVALNTAAAEAERNMQRLATMSGSAFFEFRDSIHSVAAKIEGDELTAYAGSDSPGWHLQEYGTSRLSPRGIIRKGIKAAKIKFEEGR
jgi:hypothetical protein